MDDFLNRLLERTGDFVAARPGLLPLVGIGLILANLLLRILSGSGNWLVDTDLLLHVGLVCALLGILLIRPLE